MNLLTKRWSPIVIVFCIDPVGTLTACTMKVMPNSAMITVTTADSKYSRGHDFGGPLGLTGGTFCSSWPLRLKIRENEKRLVSVEVSGSPVFTLSVVGLVAIENQS